MKILKVLFFAILLASISINVIFFLSVRKNTLNNRGKGNLMEIKSSFGSRVLLQKEKLDTINSQYYGLNLESGILLEKPDIENTLFFRIPEYSCSVCVNREISFLKNRIKSADKDKKIAILTAYQTRRDYIVFMKANKLSFPVYNLYPGLAFDKDNDKPYYFKTTKHGVLFDIFFPMKNTESFSKVYLDAYFK